MQWGLASQRGGFTMTLMPVVSSQSPGYVLSRASYDEKFTNLTRNTIAGAGRDFLWRPDGSSFYTTEVGRDDANSIVVEIMRQYDCATRFDVSTATEVSSVSFNRGTANENGWSVQFSQDGKSLFATTNTREILKYTLSTAYDLSTATYDSTIELTEFISSATPRIRFAGGKLFMQETLNDPIREYTLATAFDASTRTFVDSLDTDPTTDAVRNFKFDVGGGKLFILGGSSSDEGIVYLYNLSTAFDISTASLSPTTLDVSSELSVDDHNAVAFDFAKGGQKLHILSDEAGFFGGSDAYLYQYSVS